MLFLCIYSRKNRITQHQSSLYTVETESSALCRNRHSADDCIIMVGSEMSAKRVMRNISRFIEEKLGLKVNVTKSKVDRPSGLKYLGFGFYFDTRAHQFKAKPHAKSVAMFKKRMKELTCRSCGVSNSYKVKKLNQLIRGWINYFKIGSMKTRKRQITRLN